MKTYSVQRNDEYDCGYVTTDIVQLVHSRQHEARPVTLPCMIILLVVFLIIAIYDKPVSAQTDSHLNTSASTELLLDGDDVVTTATRTAERLNDAPAAVTIISAADIAASGATTIPELLRSVPGVDVMQLNESQQNVSIRGFNNSFANTVLVMVDGKRINEDVHSSLFWSTRPILISRIKKIEIVRGPGSVLYGADAFSGVINIILKTPSELASESKKGSLVGQFERHDTQFAEGIYTAVSKDKTLDTTFGYGYHGIAGSFQGQPIDERDSSSVPIATFDMQKQMPRGSIELSLEGATAKADMASELTVRGGSLNSGAESLTYTEDRGANPVTIRYYETIFRADQGSVYSHTKSGELDIQQIRPISPGSSLTYGASYRSADVKTEFTGPDNRCENLRSFFLQDQNQIGSNTTLFAGVRNDNQSIYGNQISTKLSAVRHLSSNHTLRLSYGTAFSAPTFLENYMDLSYPIAPGLNSTFIDNTSLKPEEIAGTEAGYRVDYGTGFAGINIFYNHISDIILPAATAFAPAPYPPGIPVLYQYQNSGSAHCDGLELEAGFPLSHGWSALANYSYEDARDQQGNLEDYSPQDKANLILQSDPKRRVSTKIAYHYVSSTNSNGEPLRAYMTVDARLAYRLGKSQNAWTAAISTVNLLDDHHREYLDVTGTSPNLDLSESAQRSVRIELSGKF